MSDDPIIPSLGTVEVERAIRRLPFLEREALLMKARDRMTYVEIGAVLGLTPAQAEARVAFALIKVHARLFRRRRPRWRALLRLPPRLRAPPYD